VRGAGALAVLVGVLAVVQGRINGELGLQVNDGILAAVISFSTGMALLAVIVSLRPTTRAALFERLPALLRSRDLRWWQLIGGFCGAFFVASQGITIPSLGVALFTVLVVAGTTGSSLLIDAAGIGPGGRRAITSRRVVGAVGTTLAVVVAVSGRFSAGSLALSAVILTVTAGALTSFQQAINAQVAVKTGDPLASTTLNFVLGLSALLAALAVEHLVLGHVWMAPPSPLSAPVLWLGGPIGVAFILVSARVVGPLGVLLYSLLSVGGQLGGSLLLDLLVPTDGTSVGWQLVAGVVLTGLAVTYTAVRR
jgi:transporter family-2 protein